MKLLRTIRLDRSDTFVFERAAEPGEWAVVGSFVFWQDDLTALSGKRRQAFRAGFLGTASLGFSTLTVVATATPQQRDEAVAELADRLMTHFGAPDPDLARRAAAEEFAFAASLADHAPETLVAMHRTHEDGNIREQFRTLTRKADADLGLDPKHWRAFTFYESEGEDEAEEVDLTKMLPREKTA